MIKSWNSFVLCAVLALLSGCSSAPQKNDREARDAYERAKSKMDVGAHQRKPNEVAPGFELKMSSPEDSNLDGRYRIEFEGRLKLPYEVKVETDGLTLDQLRSRIAEAYSKFFKTSPHISLSIAEERYWVDVRGLVEKPGRFLVKKSTSLDELISLAGGLQKLANVRYLKIQQGSSAVTVKLSEYYAGSPLDQIPPWQGGDVLFFQTDRGQNPLLGGNEGAFVQLIGEVRNPGEYRFVNDEDFYYYLVKAGGPTATADLKGVQIVRQTVEGKKILDFNLNNPGDVPTIRSGDIILLASDKPTTFERTIPVVSGLVGILNTVLLLILVF